MWAVCFNCRTYEAAHTAATIEKDGTASHQARAEDALSWHTQCNFICTSSVNQCGLEALYRNPESDPPQVSSTKSQSSSCVMMPSSSQKSSAAWYLSLYFWIHKNPWCISKRPKASEGDLCCVHSEQHCNGLRPMTHFWPKNTNNWWQSNDEAQALVWHELQYFEIFMYYSVALLAIEQLPLQQLWWHHGIFCATVYISC